MPNTRHIASVPTNSAKRTLRSLSIRFSPGHCIDSHTHDWSQLIYATDGVMTVCMDTGRWVVPPRRAILVSAGERHSIKMHGTVFLQTVYLQQSRDADCGRVLHIHALMHELIRHVCHLGIVRPESLENRTLIRFFQQQLRQLQPLDSQLKMPADERAQRFANLILSHPGTTESLDIIARECATSLRTLQRIFSREVGMSVGKWHRRVKMLRAIELLGQKESVTSVAMSLGFDSVSAFIHSFKTCFGTTPGKYQPK